MISSKSTFDILNNIQKIYLFYNLQDITEKLKSNRSVKLKWYSFWYCADKLTSESNVSHKMVLYGIFSVLLKYMLFVY